MADSARHPLVAGFQEWDHRVGSWVGRAFGALYVVAALLCAGAGGYAATTLSGSVLLAVFIPLALLGCFSAFKAWRNFLHRRTASELVFEEVRRQAAPVDYSLRTANWVRKRVQRTTSDVSDVAN